VPREINVVAALQTKISHLSRKCKFAAKFS